MTVRRLATLERWIGPALFVGYVMALVWTAPDLALSRDEKLLRTRRPKTTAPGSGRSFRTPSRWRSRRGSIARGGTTGEHPALMKVAFAISGRLHDATGLFSSDSLAFRFSGHRSLLGCSFGLCTRGVR